MAKKQEKKAAVNFEEEAAVPTDKELEQVSKLASKQLAIENELENLEDKIKECKQRLVAVSEVDLPAAMQSIGLKQIVLNTGQKIIIKEDVDASITKGERGAKDNRPEAFTWLRENGYGDLIKNEVKISLGMEEDKKFAKLTSTLEKLGFDNYSANTSVHAGTLKSFVKEQLEAGKPLPDSITVRQYKVAVIKSS